MRASARGVAGDLFNKYGALAAGVAAVWLGYQVVTTAVAQRLPAELALRLKPDSSTVLAKSAENSLARGRTADAEVLAKSALGRAPFNGAALRVLGLAYARDGRTAEADALVTLAGNWSLRDDAAHGWLIEQRLRQGNYSSAFAHADTLARRREDIRPQLFKLFTTAGLNDPRSVPPLTRLLEQSPPWREDYLTELTTSSDAIPLQATLALALERTAAPMSDEELGRVYTRWMNTGRVQAVKLLRTALGRPNSRPLVQDGGFAGLSTPAPFGWHAFQTGGIDVEMMAPDDRPNDPALRVGYDGFSSASMIEQVTTLDPGRYGLSIGYRVEDGSPDAEVSWKVICVGTGRVLTEVAFGRIEVSTWRQSRTRFVVPSADCPVQVLRLMSPAGDRRDHMDLWFDNIAVDLQ